MQRGKGRPIAEEVRALESALGALDAAVERLREADETVGELLAEAAETVAMPNSRRAGQQLRTALNAAAGARTALVRRLELRRSGLAPGPRPPADVK